MEQVLGITYLLCYRKCRLMDVVDDIAFFPPMPPFYVLRKEDNKIKGTCFLWEGEIEIPETISIQFLPIQDGISICMMHYKVESPKRVIIYSHPNAVDLGLCVNLMALLGPKLNCDFIFYDYEGYGYSGGEMHMYKYARQFFPGSAIYLLGESIGSVPSCYLAAELSVEYEALHSKGEHPAVPLAGVIMQAAVFAGSKFPCGGLIRCCDPLNNAKLIQNVKFPTFHIHGMEDDTIPFELGKQLHEKGRQMYEPWWVEGAKHMNIVDLFEDEYCTRIKEFFTFCEERIKQDEPEGAMLPNVEEALRNNNVAETVEIPSCITNTPTNEL